MNVGIGLGGERRRLMMVVAAGLVLGTLSLLGTMTRRRRQLEQAPPVTPDLAPASAAQAGLAAPPVRPTCQPPELPAFPPTPADPVAEAPTEPIRRPPSIFGSEAEPDDEASGATGLRAYKWQAFVAVGTAFFTIVAASTMVFVLLSAIADDFGVTLRAVGWVVIVESLIISALLLPMGAVADTFGRRRMFVFGLVIFGAGSIMSGLAPSFAALIAARTVTAVGNASVQSVITGMLVAAFPPEERGRAVGAQTTAVSVGAACGPLIGGLGLQAVSWQTLFLLLGIPVAVSIVAAQLILRDDRADRADRAGASRTFDRVGSCVSAATVVVLVVTISNPLGFRWLSWPTLAGVVAVTALLVLFIRWELGHPAPMIELRLFAISSFRWAVVVRLLGFTGYATTALLLPIYLVSYRGVADGTAGAIIFLVAAGTGISAQISGNLSDWIGPRAPTAVGLIGQILVSLVLAVFAGDLSTGALMVVVFASGLSASQWNVPNNSAMMGSVPADNLGVIGAFTNVVRTMGSVLGQAVATAVVVAVMAKRGFDIPLSEIAETPGAGAAFLDGWSAAFIVVAAAAAIALFAALRLPAHPIGVERK